MIAPSLRLAALGLVAFLLAACDDTKLVRMCGSDKECAPGFSCNEDGRCVCMNDTACALNEVCNPLGQCQVRVGCETSLDCPKGQFCDHVSGNCLDSDRCTADVQCALGYVCDPVRFACVMGCRDVGDCRIGAVCECENEASSCAVGRCREGPCGDSSYCKYGESCVAEVEGAEKRCVKDDRGPFCEPCTFGPGQETCRAGPDDANFCLVDTSMSSRAYFCGVDCDTADECPWGFGCHDVLILTEQTCGGVNACPLREKTCADDADCPGGACDLTAGGLCRASCVMNEGDVQGFCTCLADSDCPQDHCDSMSQRCSFSQKPCDPEALDPCPTIYCKNEKDDRRGTEVGYCFIGRNCAPEEGITCEQVRAR